MDKNNKIFRNTIYLYIRMFLSMGISLYISRVTLQILGVEDFGIYNVIAGVIALFGFLTASMSSAVSRFFSYELGRSSNQSKLTEIFSSSFWLHLILAILVIVLTECIGLWFLETKLVIPVERFDIAVSVFHISVATVFIAIVKVPYVALVFSREKMEVYAVFEILIICLKLVLILSLEFIKIDTLLVYSFVIFIIEVFSLLLYSIYDSIKFKECAYKFSLDKATILPILKFSAWDLYGNASVVGRTQGVNILLNMFFGPILNASSGIATQVQGALSAFSNNILVAFRPQIVKSFANGDITTMVDLLNKAVLFTSILLLMIVTPLAVEIEYVLTLWLGEFPKFTIELTRLTLLFLVLSNISSVIMAGIHATGYVKKSSIINGTLYLTVLPLAYIGFKAGYSPLLPFIINPLFVFVGSTLNMFYLSKYIPEFNWSLFFLKNIIPLFILSIFIGFILYFMKDMFEIGFLRVVVLSLMSVTLYPTLSFLFLINKATKALIVGKIKLFFIK